MAKTAAVITISDKGARGERQDTSGPALKKQLQEAGLSVVHTCVIPDEEEGIKAELIRAVDHLGINLVLTTGGTGFARRDVTPEATRQVITREAPGIAEMMRSNSAQITDRACLSRAVSGIRGNSLIVNLPGSEKAARENLSFVLQPILHGLDILLSEGSADCAPRSARILAVCISEKKGEQKHPVPAISLLPDHGIKGDAHAGSWHRQVSLLGKESVDKVQQHIDFELLPGAFAENILTEGILLYELPVGTRLMVGTALCEVTQIGKECHFGCAIREAAGDCVMPREGIFVKVIKAGEAKAGDLVSVLA